MGAFHSKALNSLNTARESFHGSFASLFQPLQILFSPEAAAVFISVDVSRREAFIERCGRISEYETAAKCRLDRLVCGALSSPGKKPRSLVQG